MRDYQQQHRPYQKMAASRSRDMAAQLQRNMSAKVILSYAFDWLVLLIVAGASGALSRIAPHKRPFSLSDPNISCVSPPFMSLWYSWFGCTLMAGLHFANPVANTGSLTIVPKLSLFGYAPSSLSPCRSSLFSSSPSSSCLAPPSLGTRPAPSSGSARYGSFKPRSWALP